jgi:hypothetical protein
METEGVERTLFFSGWQWTVKDSQGGRVGPGPNYFSSAQQSVWVDKDGQLHLRLRKQKSVLATTWACAEVFVKQATGYGSYTCVTSSNVDALDANIVLGLFSYQDDEKEIDIEWARWGEPHNDNCQFVVQPGTPSSTHRKNVLLKGREAVNCYVWKQEEVAFSVDSG